MRSILTITAWPLTNMAICDLFVPALLTIITSIATAAKQPSSKPQGFDERSSYLGIAYF